MERIKIKKVRTEMGLITLSNVDNECGNPYCDGEIKDNAIVVGQKLEINWLSDPANSMNGVMTCGSCGHFSGQPLADVQNLMGEQDAISL